MRIRLIGGRNNTGVGVHYSNFCDQLKQLQGTNFEIEEISGESQDALRQAAATSRDSDVNICFVGMDLKGHFRGTIIQWIVFESTRVPDILFNCLHYSDMIWVPSTWGKQVLIDNGYSASKIEVVPEGVDALGFHPYYTPAPEPLQFLSVGKFEERKSFHETLDAWKQAFGNDPNVRLVIKTHVFSDEPAKLDEVKGLLDQLGLSNVVVAWGPRSPDGVKALYRQSHVFVLPTKGEGWGLPLIEAAAAGLPIVTTNYSAQTEFLQPSSCVFVDYNLAHIDCKQFQACYPGQTEWGKWAMPDTDSIAQALITARRDYSKLRAEAVQNSSTIRQRFSWAQCADQALKVLQKRNILK